MKSNLKRGFTVIELVIVVAVVAVIAAVMIPTFSNIVTNAQNSNDFILIRNIQTILEYEKMLGADITDESKALEILKNNGINDIVTSCKTNEIVWDRESMNFVLYSSEGDIISEGNPPEIINNDHDRDGQEGVGADKEQTVTLTVSLSSSDLVYSDEDSDAVTLNEPYAATITVPYTQYLTKYCVKMGGVDITESCASVVDGNISIRIDQVTDALEITANAVENRVRTSKDLTGKYIYGNTENGYNTQQNANGKGYVDNACLSDSNNSNGMCVSAVKTGYDSAAGYTSTGWIYLPWDDMASDIIVVYVYIQDGTLITNTDGCYRYYFYADLEKEYEFKDIKEAASLVNSNYMIIQLDRNTYSLYKYFRLSVKGSGENLVVTFNEPIFP